MPEHFDLDEIADRVSRGIWPPLMVVMAMRNELVAWRATHQAAGESLASMEGVPPMARAGAEAYHSAFADSLRKLGVEVPADQGRMDTGSSSSGGKS